MTNEQLIELAKLAQEKSYSPYSKFAVGACLLSRSGKTYLGCNIENASYGATNCAERTAIFKAVSEGDTSFDRIAIVGGDYSDWTYPCGICLQVLLEFMPDGIIVLEKNGVVRELKLQELLPYGFQLELDEKQMR